MAETQSNFSDEILTGPAGPVQPLEAWADDIIAQRGMDYSSDKHSRLVAQWEDSVGHDLCLEKLGWGVSSIYRLRVSLVGQAEPVASFKYRQHMPGVHYCDRDWKEVGNPTLEHENAMEKYLQTAQVTPRHGLPDEQVNKAFWGIAARVTATDSGVQALLKYAAKQQNDAVQLELIERAVTRMQTLEKYLPEDLICAVLNEQIENQQ